MKVYDNFGKEIGAIDVAVANDKVVTINRSAKATTLTTLDRNTGRFVTETFYGDHPFGK